MQKIWYVVLIFYIAMSVVSCGGGSDGSSSGAQPPAPTQPSLITGTFIDARVQGIEYLCSSGSSGITDSNGEFTCEEGDSVEFMLGSLTLGPIESTSGVISPYSLFPDDYRSAVNLARVLQSLDTDGNSGDSVIQLDETLAEQLTISTEVLSSRHFETLVETMLGIELIDSDQAQTQMNSALEAEGVSLPSDAYTMVTETEVLIHNGVRYEVILAPNGRYWLDRNLGAERVCQSYDDSACYGDYYQWGRAQDGHENSTSGTSDSLSTDIVTDSDMFITSDNDWTSADPDGSVRQGIWFDNPDTYSTNPSLTENLSICPAGFRVPTTSEIRDAILNVGIGNKDDGFASYLKLPAAGYRQNDDGEVIADGQEVYLWTSSIDSSNLPIHLLLPFEGADSELSSVFPALGHNIRCIEKRAPYADAGNDITVTLGQEVTVSASSSLAGDFALSEYQWIHDGETISAEETVTLPALAIGTHAFTLIVTDVNGNQGADRVEVTVVEEEIITFNGFTYHTIVSPYTGRIWLDRNIGAFDVCDTADNPSCFGDYFQFGRAADGHEKSANSTVDREVATNFVTANNSENLIIPFHEELLRFQGDWTNDDFSLVRREQRFDSANALICPLGFRVPRSSEFRTEINQASYSLENPSLEDGLDAVVNFLNLAKAGWRVTADGTRSFSGVETHLWTSSLARDAGAWLVDPIDTVSVISWSPESFSSINFGFLVSKPVDAINIRCIKHDYLPVADAGVSQTWQSGSNVLLDGSLSSDDNGIVSYQWEINGETISNQATFSLDSLNEGRHHATLTVTDTQGQSDTDTILINVTSRPTTSVEDVYGIDYQEVISPFSGRIWLDRNLGASRVCTSSTDEDCYGHLFQWGRTADGHQFRDSSTSNEKLNAVSTDTTGGQFIFEFDDLEKDWATDVITSSMRVDYWRAESLPLTCPEGYRVPTRDELSAETLESFDRTLNSTDAFRSYLKLPAAGLRSPKSADILVAGLSGFYWSTNYTTLNNAMSLIFEFDDIDIYASYDFAAGMSLRCTKNEFAPSVIVSGATRILPRGHLVLDASQSFDLDGEIVSYQWYLNGELLSTEDTLSTNILEADVHDINLTVVDDQGLVSSKTIAVTVSPNTSLTHNGVAYNSITSSVTGLTWLDRNNGASRVCEALDDPECFGWYYQFGRNDDGHQFPDSEVTTIKELDINNSSDKFVTNDDWTEIDISNRYDNWAKYDGSSVCPANFVVPRLGLPFEMEFGPSNRLTQYDAFYSEMKLPSAGTRYLSFGGLGEETVYWINSFDQTKAWSNNGVGTDTGLWVANVGKAIGIPVRCVSALSNTYLYPFAIAGQNQTIIEGTSVRLNAIQSRPGEAQIVDYQWSLEGEVLSSEVIFDVSLLPVGEHKFELKVTDSNGESSYDYTWVTVSEYFAAKPPTIYHQGVDYQIITSEISGQKWLDRNLGAEQACISGVEENCRGWYFQFGRSVDGHQLPDSGVVNTQTYRLDFQSPFILTPQSEYKLILEDRYYWLRDWLTYGTDTQLQSRSASWADVNGDSICPEGFRVPTVAEFEAEKTRPQVNTLNVSYAGSRQPNAGILNLSVYAELWALNNDYTAESGMATYYKQLKDGAYGSEAYSIMGESVLDIARPVRCIMVVDNSLPVANAGGNRVIDVDAVEIINGTSSYDSDGKIIHYEWRDENDTLISNESGFFSSLLDVGLHEITLTVTDNLLDSATDTVTIEITDSDQGLIIHNGIAYGVVVSPYTGREWLDRNIGATQVCEFSADPNCVGGYYQFGRPGDGHQLPSSPEIDTPFDSLVPDNDAFVRYNSDWTTIDTSFAGRVNNWANVTGQSICPSGFRLPTEFEINQETRTQGLSTEDEMFASFLKLGNVGRRFASYEPSITDPGTDTLYWTSTQGTEGTIVALYFNYREAALFYMQPAAGAAVRCISAY